VVVVVVVVVVKMGVISSAELHREGERRN